MTPQHLPTFIPAELCQAVGVSIQTAGADPLGWSAKCLEMARTDINEDGVAAPSADVAGLKDVIAKAHAKNIDLKVIALPNNPGIDTPLRDIATEIGKDHPDATILVISPSFAGTYSATFDRVTLEAGQDVAKTGNPVLSANNFVDEVGREHFSWTALTIVLVLLVAAACAGITLLRGRFTNDSVK
ncbi:DUF6676 family protein [Mycobacteroides salmoniphilum]|uniref:Uncharacterized protein n=1 Tax=Mycobacteroides salmoniphilum TaxID=404941 RepID=A0A4R8SD31_9MYCO|nr:DUF6676 family protein [Mycobacteroides salmoniphilum]TDZ93250.1 hypothetical protein CCUG60885_03755 [Mycobacteroides salmoniphilum]TEA07841.1 hypothetical protein CCUG60883_00905 [Mycobacteroides salmoniphilum]